MRISDWSSDVCSSDLAGHILFLKPRERAGPTNLIVTTSRGGTLRSYAFELTARSGPITGRNGQAYFQVRFRYPRDEAARAERLRAAQIAMQAAALERSEEHTSELQSLMRISYAVFCLKQKKKKHTAYNCRQIL